MSHIVTKITAVLVFAGLVAACATPVVSPPAAPTVPADPIIRKG